MLLHYRIAELLIYLFRIEHYAFVDTEWNKQSEMFKE